MQTICEQPDELEARLVLADHWLEQEDLRGQFISVQCCLENSSVVDPAYVGLKRMEALLLPAMVEVWQQQAPCPVQGLTFRRGMVHGVRVAAHDLVNHLEQLFAWSPLRHLEITGATHEHLTLLGECAHRAPLIHLESLELLACSAEHSLECLFANKGLEHLQKLHVQAFQTTTLNVEQIFAQFAGKLSHLRLSDWEISPENIQALGRIPGVRHLRGLGFKGCSLMRTTWKTLCEHPAFSSLETMAMDGVQLDTRAMNVMRLAKAFPRIQSWSADLNRMDASALEELGKSVFFPRLKHLSMGGNPVQENGWERLMRALDSSDGQLQSLAMWNCGLHTGSAGLMSQCQAFREVTSLCLGNNRIGDLGLHMVMRSPYFEKLSKLQLWSCSLADKAGEVMRKAIPKPYLTSLDLSNNRVGDDSCNHLANCSFFGNLLELSLQGNNISDQGAVRFTKSKQLPNLVTVDFSQNKISPTMLSTIGETIRSRMPLKPQKGIRLATNDQSEEPIQASLVRGTTGLVRGTSSKKYPNVGPRQTARCGLGSGSKSEEKP
jgi:uncharacterized protein (TIGR02996 family)